MHIIRFMSRDFQLLREIALVSNDHLTTHAVLADKLPGVSFIQLLDVQYVTRLAMVIALFSLCLTSP